MIWRAASTKINHAAQSGSSEKRAWLGVVYSPFLFALAPLAYALSTTGLRVKVPKNSGRWWVAQRFRSTFIVYTSSRPLSSPVALIEAQGAA